jgi:hypothetical protein
VIAETFGLAKSSWEPQEKFAAQTEKFSDRGGSEANEKSPRALETGKFPDSDVRRLVAVARQLDRLAVRCRARRAVPCVFALGQLVRKHEALLGDELLERT